MRIEESKEDDGLSCAQNGVVAVVSAGSGGGVRIVISDAAAKIARDGDGGSIVISEAGKIAGCEYGGSIVISDAAAEIAREGDGGSVVISDAAEEIAGGGHGGSIVISDAAEKIAGGGGSIVISDAAEKITGGGDRNVVSEAAKRAMVGVGARVLFYPTLLYNVARNRVQAEFHWWDRVDEFILLGAVPFPADVPCLKELGVQGVVTLNESYETLVPSSLYHAHGIDHLVIPTRDYCFAPSLSNISRAVGFIHKNASCGKTTYVHCKAGRGRSTTIVLCYLVKHKQMTPDAAYDYVRSVRSRVRLAASQWQAVQEYYHLKVQKALVHSIVTDRIRKSQLPAAGKDIAAFDDGSVVVVTEADLDGYDPSLETRAAGGGISTDLSVVYRVRVAGQTVLARISCMWLRCHADHNTAGDEMAMQNGCSIEADRLGSITVDIPVY